ncbi:Alpha/Beta hydrolase protein [Lasiosphaeria ovina]|uniref:Alpha/Beta hydrolase protein n=1 Tax=Lasiosphaeria ovina TaxID=92902 RepID=A0AAE0N7D5_9PEZI|nr:Alpha/Beta hydrolase protein [Lasiosphaeria ovina]
MADPEIATKAPESDAQEDAPAPAPVPVPTAVPTAVPTPAPAPAPAPAPTLSDHCTSDRPTPAGRASTGEITKLGDVDVYISKPADYPHTPSRLLLLLTGGTGLQSVNNQIQADRFASEGGYVVVMPDLFGGDAAPNSTKTAFSSGSESGSSLLDTFKTKAAEAAKSFMIDMWLARHTEEKVLPILHKVLDAARDEFADAVASGGGIYAVGYCFGGRYIFLLAAERPVPPPSGAGGGLTMPWSPSAAASAASPQPSDDEEASRPKTAGPYIKAGAIAHATLVSRDDFAGLKAPISVVSVEHDPMFPDEVRTAAEDYMSKNNVEHEVQVYPGVPHGFAVLGDYDDPNIQQAQVTAFEQMLKWLNDH